MRGKSVFGGGMIVGEGWSAEEACKAAALNTAEVRTALDLDRSITDRWADMCREAMATAMKKEPDAAGRVELTELETLAICAIAGCLLRFTCESGEGYRYMVSTVNPVGVVKVNGKFLVGESVGGVVKFRRGEK